jgi:hypothetical protein
MIFRVQGRKVMIAAIRVAGRDFVRRLAQKVFACALTHALKEC